MEPRAVVSQPLHEYLSFLLPGCLSLRRGERRDRLSDRLKAWEESAVFEIVGEHCEELLREAIEKYYRSAGFTDCVWNDLGVAVYRGDQWVLSVTITITYQKTVLFLTVVNIL